ncbi:trichohyalin-like isoform X35 [Scylla paramamosain]|uniref:trichohyalin-like isoform X35 n=1 Tax=Scylla paramamosain TaxID=85552 RepID=UPI0030831C8C
MVSAHNWRLACIACPSLPVLYALTSSDLETDATLLITDNRAYGWPPKGSGIREPSKSESPGSERQWQGDSWRRPNRWDQSPQTPTQQSMPSTPQPVQSAEPQANLVRDLNYFPYWDNDPPDQSPEGEPPVNSTMSVHAGDGDTLTGSENPTPWRKSSQHRNESPVASQPQHKSTLTWTPVQPATDSKQQQQANTNPPAKMSATVLRKRSADPPLAPQNECVTRVSQGQTDQGENREVRQPQQIRTRKIDTEPQNDRNSTDNNTKNKQEATDARPPIKRWRSRDETNPVKPRDDLTDRKNIFQRENSRDEERFRQEREKREELRNKRDELRRREQTEREKREELRKTEQEKEQENRSSIDDIRKRHEREREELRRLQEERDRQEAQMRQKSERDKIVNQQMNEKAEKDKQTGLNNQNKPLLRKTSRPEPEEVLRKTSRPEPEVLRKTSQLEPEQLLRKTSRPEPEEVLRKTSKPEPEVLRKTSRPEPEERVRKTSHPEPERMLKKTSRPEPEEVLRKTSRPEPEGLRKTSKPEPEGLLRKTSKIEPEEVLRKTSKLEPEGLLRKTSRPEPEGTLRKISKPESEGAQRKTSQPEPERVLRKTSGQETSEAPRKTSNQEPDKMCRKTSTEQMLKRSSKQEPEELLGKTSKQESDNEEPECLQDRVSRFGVQLRSRKQSNPPPPPKGPLPSESEEDLALMNDKNKLSNIKNKWESKIQNENEQRDRRRSLTQKPNKMENETSRKESMIENKPESRVETNETEKKPIKNSQTAPGKQLTQDQKDTQSKEGLQGKKDPSNKLVMHPTDQKERASEKPKDKDEKDSTEKVKQGLFFQDIKLKKAKTNIPEKTRPENKNFLEEVKLRKVETKPRPVHRVNSVVEFSDDEDDFLEERETPQPTPQTNTPDEGSGPPPPPPMPGLPPPPPPQPGSHPKRPTSAVKKQKLDQLKKAARSRPDWNGLLRDIESGIKLRRLPSCDKMDRSTPMLPNSRGKGGKFVYESEKPMAHNQLLHEIHRGVKLRKVKTNDRSKPCFKALGVKKLRRQLTMENINKLESIPSSSDEEEDIDKMRDDLQATKGQLEDEIKNRKKLERESKIYKIDIAALQAEVKRLKRQLRSAGINDPKPMTNGEADEIVPKLEKSMSKLRMHEDEVLDFSELDTLETEINNLKGQVDSYKKQAEDYTNKYNEVNQKLIVAENSASEWELRSNYYEKKFKALQKEHCIELPDIEIVGVQTDPIDFTPPPPSSPTEDDDRIPFPMPSKSGSRRSFASSVHKMESFKEEEEDDEDDDEEEEETEEESEESEEETEEEDEEKAAEKRAQNAARRLERDIKLMTNKLNNIKSKEERTREERKTIRDRMIKCCHDMKAEREMYFKTKRELDEMASAFKASDDEDDSSEDEDDSDDSDDSDEEEVPRKKEEGEEWWLDDTTKKPIKLKKKKKKKLDANGEEEKDSEQLPDIQEPVWSESEQEESEVDDEKNDSEKRLTKLKTRTQKHEQKHATLRKDVSALKTKLEHSEELLAAEKRRRQRLDEELHIMLAELS